jgi:hypothetical protein
MVSKDAIYGFSSCLAVPKEKLGKIRGGIR